MFLVALGFACAFVGAANGQAVPYAAEMEAALAYFQEQAELAEPKVIALKDAIAAGTLEAAKTAYIASRDEYEQIEVLAPAFGDVDCAIDCRAYAYDHGEGTSGEGTIAEDEFQGFHRIESLLFRDGNVEAALPFAEGLLDLWAQLKIALNDTSLYTFCDWWDGVIGLATEVAAKKMSSEEETFSDESILIYANNFIGIRQASVTLIEAVETIDMEAYTAANEALDAADATVAAYTAADGSFTKYSEVPFEDRAAIMNASYKLANALTAVKDALATDGGVTCAEPAEEAEVACANPNPVAATEARAAGAAYFQAIYTYNKAQVDDLIEAINSDAGLPAVKAAYMLARPLYEQIEVLAPAFPDEDEAIDARPSGFGAGEEDMDFQGFHRLEAMLYRDGLAAAADTNELTNKTLGEWATDLQTVYIALGEKITALPDSVEAVDVFDGVIGVMTEVVHKKISSEEETWSDASLMIFYNNWLGGYSQIAPFAAGTEYEAGLEAAFTAAAACVEPHITGTNTCKLGYSTDVTEACVSELSALEYKTYSTVTAADKQCITDKGYAFREQIIKVANELGVPAECHSFHANSVYQYRAGSIVETDADLDLGGEGAAPEGAEAPEGEEVEGEAPEGAVEEEGEGEIEEGETGGAFRTASTVVTAAAVVFAALL